MTVFKTLITICAISIILNFSSYSGELEKPWETRHFPNAPRISADQALNFFNTGQKVVLIDIPWTNEGFEKGHVCGAIKAKTNPIILDKIIKRIPKQYIIFSY